ncbi:MAG: hypothetical protein ABIF09_18615 [Gemmatimonadota bacterium]
MRSLTLTAFLFALTGCGGGEADRAEGGGPDAPPSESLRLPDSFRLFDSLQPPGELPASDTLQDLSPDTAEAEVTASGLGEAFPRAEYVRGICRVSWND